MARSPIQLEGFKELEADLRELPNGVGRGVARRAVKRAADEMAGDMSNRAPVDEGELRDSITVKVRFDNLDGKAEYAAARRSGASSKEAGAALVAARRSAKASGNQKGHSITASIGPTAPHAHFVEDGTVKMGPQPFVRPAFDSGVDRAVRTVKEGLIDELAKSAARMGKRKAKKI